MQPISSAFTTAAALPPAIAPAGARSSTTGSGSAGGSGGAGGISSTFLQLLTTELQTQDPLSAQDPTTYITQLVQLNTLDQLTQINSLLQAHFPQPAGGASGTTAGAGSTPAIASLANFLKGASH